MNPFHQALLTGGEESVGDIENLTLRILSGQETVLTSLIWFHPYRASEFPEVVCNKDYFFLYSTDHATDGGLGVWWGKGNNLNLSDFEEIGQVVSGGSTPETPFLIRVPLAENPDTEVLHLFYHTDATQSGNGGIQQTRLRTSAGGAELHLMNWTDRGRPLGVEPGEDHTGYFMPYRKYINEWIGTHIIEGGLPQEWYFSTATHPRNWIRGTEINTTHPSIESGYFGQPSSGRYFHYLNRQWWMGSIHPDDGTKTGSDRLLILAKAETEYGTLIQQEILNNGAGNIRHSIYIDGDTAHIYIVNPTTTLYHATYDLRNLKLYL